MPANPKPPGLPDAAQVAWDLVVGYPDQRNARIDALNALIDALRAVEETTDWSRDEIVCYVDGCLRREIMR